MKSNFLRTVSIVTATALLVGCGSSGGDTTDTEAQTPETLTSVQSEGTAPANKGPFAVGSTVTAYKLNSDGSRSSESNTTQTVDDKGTFTISVSWEGPTELNIVGDYLNETTGTYMNDGDLSAIVDMKSDGNNSLGINIFTHMAASVIRNKMASDAGADFATLKEESKEVIAEQFNLQLDNDTALEDLDVTSSDEDANVQLLQISAALMNTPNPAETLANISEDLSNGAVDDEGQAALEELDEEMEQVDIVTVAQNIENNVEGTTVPQALDVLNGTLAWDSDIVFTPVNDVALNTQQTSSMVTVNGVIGEGAALSIENGQYILNGAVPSSADTTVKNGDQLVLVGTSSDIYNSESKVLVTIGGETIPFVIRTQADPDANNDAVPNEFDFGFKKDIAANSSVSSDEIIVSGINTATPISIDNGTFTVNGESATEVNNGDKVVVSLTSGALGETKKATVTIGGVQGKFVVSSEPKDSMPTIVGTFQSVAGVDKATAVISNEIEITDINVDVPVTISDAEFSINGEAFTTSATVSDGDKIRVSVSSADAFDTKKEVALNVGAVVVPFEVQTKSDPVVPDRVPDSFSFNAQTTRVANTPITSNTITVGSINEAVEISIEDGTYSVNGGAFTSEASTVNEGDKVVLQVVSADYGASEKAIVTIGGVSATFLVSTIKDESVDLVSFESKEGVRRNVLIESDAITVSGINVPVPVTIVGGEYSIDNGEYVSSAGTVVDGQSIKVRVNSAATPLASASALLTVGNLQVPFMVTTQASIPPVSTTDTITTPEDTMVVIDVLGNDSDVDGDALSIANLSVPEHGTAVVVDGKVHYTPAQDFAGEDSFTYQASDGMVLGSTVTVTVNVTAVNDAPKVEDKSMTVAEDSEGGITLTATDIDGDSPSFTIVTQPAHGSVTLEGALATYVPNKDYVGVDSFTYTASDASETSTPATVNITLTPVNDAPIAVEDTMTTDKFTEVTLDVLGNDSDVDGDSLTITDVVAPSSGSASIVGNKILYRPSGDFTGTVSFTYVVSDGQSTSSANVTVEVTEVQSKLVTALNILEATDFENDDVEATLDEVKTTLDSANELDKDAKVGQAVFALAEISNSEEVGELIDISLDGSSVSYANNLPAIVEGLSREDALEVSMVEGISDMSTTSTDVLHDVVLKLEDIETALGEAFADENYIFSYNDMNLTANESKLLRASILAAASKLEYVAAFNYLSEDDIETRTITVDGVTAEYDNISSNPIEVLNRSDVGSLSSPVRLSKAKELLLSSVDMLNQVDATKEEDPKDVESIENAQSEAVNIKASIEGTASYVLENEEDERVEKIYLNLAALYNENSVLDMTHTLGHEFVYSPENDYFNGVEYTTGSYNLETSQFYNDAMSNEWIASDGTAITYVEGEMDRPRLELKPVIPMGADNNIPSVITKVEVVEGEQTSTYEGDDLLRYLFTNINLEEENTQFSYSNSEDINITYRVEDDGLVAMENSSYNFELLTENNGLHLTMIDATTAQITADAGLTDDLCYTIRVSDVYGHSDERGMCLYVDILQPRIELTESDVVLNQGETQRVGINLINLDSVTLMEDAPDFVSIDTNTNELVISPTTDTAVQGYDVELNATGEYGDVQTSLYIKVQDEDANHAPTMSLSSEYVMLNLVDEERTTVEILADDVDGDALTYSIEEGVPSFITISGNILSITPTTNDEGVYDISIIVSDGELSSSSNLHIEVLSEAPDVEIDFSRSVASGSYDSNATVDISNLFGTDMYDLYFSSNDGNSNLEVEKFALNTTSVTISKMNDDETWEVTETLSANTENDVMTVDTDSDGSAKFTVKFTGTISDSGILNSIAGVEIFGEGAEAYHFLYKQLLDSIEFNNDDEYVRSYNNTADEYYHSLSEFIENQQGSHWFSSNDNGEGGISFAEGSTGTGGTLVEVDANGVVVNTDAGTWEINSDNVLLTMPTVLGYDADAFKEVTVDGEGRLLRGDYERAGDEEEFLWFNEAGKDQFLSFFNTQEAL